MFVDVVAVPVAEFAVSAADVMWLVFVGACVPDTAAGAEEGDDFSSAWVRCRL